MVRKSETRNTEWQELPQHSFALTLKREGESTEAQYCW